MATRLVDAAGGEHARLIEAAVVVGATTTLVTLVANPWLRAWARVKVAKHLFRHRYDYRAAWQRFSETLGQPDGAAPLASRIVKAVAELTDSPAGLLLAPMPRGCRSGAAGAGRGGRRPATMAPVPRGWRPAAGSWSSMRCAPAPRRRRRRPRCPTGCSLPRTPGRWCRCPWRPAGGAILLARPPVDRALDWEDFDLLRVAGRQAASYLAEDARQAALAEARRFDEFNRRFAFIVHDVKNLVSQLGLVARNAERHADNPAFRADMVATLKESRSGCNDLLARLSQHTGERAEPAAPVDDRRAARAHRGGAGAQHPIGCAAATGALALATRAARDWRSAISSRTRSRRVRPTRRSALSVERRGQAIEVARPRRGMSAAFVRDELFRAVRFDQARRLRHRRVRGARSWSRRWAAAWR